MVAYELLVSMGSNVAFLIDGSEFSVVQVSPAFLQTCWCLPHRSALFGTLELQPAVKACMLWLLLSHADHDAEHKV